MNWVDKLSARTWSILVICMLAFAISGCEGDTGPAGQDGLDGQDGADGSDAPAASEVEVKVAAANVESCSVCHGGAGGYHQAAYDAAFDSDFVLTIDAVTSVGAGPYDVTIDFSIAYMGAAFDVDPTSADWVDGLFFGVSQWDATAEMFVLVGGPFDPFSGITGPITSNGGGSYTLTASLDYNINSWDSGGIVGKLSDDELDWADSPTSHFHVYNDLTLDAVEVGMGSLAADYQSLANVEGCEACHGAPYRKHGNVQASVPGAPDFTYCKSCHYDDRVGGHEEWQFMADDPYAWATGAAPTGDYAYTANVMNDTHMSHAMEFPYPMSMSNCVTCHDGNIDEILDDTYFTLETCKSCHVVDGVNAWPEGVITGDEGDYYRPHSAPALTYLWAEGDVAYHNVDMDCGACHGQAGFPGFADMHTGYDATVYDDVGDRYSDLYTVSVDDVVLNGDLLTVSFSSNNVDVDPTLAISFYGWDSKNFIIPAHERDSNGIDCPHNSRPGCNIEWSPGSTKPFFTEEAGSVAGAWIVTFDMTGFQPYKTDPIPTLIADGVVKYAEISVLPELEIAGDEVNLEATSTSFDLGGGLVMDDYFQGANASVDMAKCAACHENTGVLVHTGSGRYGDSMQVCKVCHNPTFDGGHMEMQSRSIDSYVHALHAMQPLDEDDVYNENDPVDELRNEMHKNHTFPNFTTLSCEGCHVNDMSAYDVPDQALSMPGSQSSSYSLDDPNDRLIGTVPEAVQGAGSRACGSCHRAGLIIADAAGDLAAFDAHTAAFGTFIENSPKDDDGDGLDEEPVLFGIVDKIMGLFQ